MSRILQDHGTAERLPPMDDDKAWAAFRGFLGNSGEPERQADGLAVTTIAGRVVAKPGDWLIRTVNGALHLGRAER